MSGDSHETPERETLLRVELAVGRAVERIRELESEVRDARRRAGELDRVLVRIAGGELEPTDLVERLRALEEENADLRGRLAAGRERVERLLAKIRFLEER